MSKRPLTGLGSDTEQLARQALRAAYTDWQNSLKPPRAA